MYALDAATIEQLRQAGADLTERRETFHYLYVEDEPTGRSVEQALRGPDRNIAVQPAASGGGWLVLVGINIVVDAATIGSLRSQFEAVAARYGGEYDGWEASLEVSKEVDPASIGDSPELR
jgi:hypothetical protein